MTPFLSHMTLSALLLHPLAVVFFPFKFGVWLRLTVPDKIFGEHLLACRYCSEFTLGDRDDARIDIDIA